jgi:hypothetical protein
VAAARASRVAAFAAMLAIVGLGIDACFWWLRFGLIAHRHLAAMVLAGAILGVLWATRARPREWLATAAFCANSAAVLTALWATDARLSHVSHWDPFEAQKLGALTVALVTPPRAWVGFLGIAAFTAVPIVELATWGPRVHADLPPAVPFTVIAYGVFACGILALQLRRMSVEQRDADRQARAAALERFADLLLSLRDLANTPLQTIELTLASVERSDRLHARAVARLRRACTQLIDIARLIEEADREEGVFPPR